ncbi:MAG TPA: hypothetical protein VFA58_00550, partial [Chthoniobacterales bacterium]|nr:hypothetical protein [Chthoniobacterales bacterium]
YVAFFFAFAAIPQSAWNQPPRTSNPAATATAAPAGRVSNPAAPPVAVFRIIGGIMSGFVALAWTAGALTIYSGRCIKQRKHRVLVYIMAALNCLFVPYGTLLGVFTFIVLGSPEAVAEWNDPVL